MHPLLLIPAIAALAQPNPSLLNQPAPSIASARSLAGTPTTTFEPGSTYLLSFWFEHPPRSISGFVASLNESAHLKLISDLLAADDGAAKPATKLRILHLTSAPAAAYETLRARFTSDPCLNFSIALDPDDTIAKSFHTAAPEAAPTLFLIDARGRIAWSGAWLPEALAAASALDQGTLNTESLTKRADDYRRQSAALTKTPDIATLNKQASELATAFPDWSSTTTRLHIRRASQLLTGKPPTPESTEFSTLVRTLLDSPAAHDRLVLEETLAISNIAHLNDPLWLTARRDAADRLVQLDRLCDWRNLERLAAACADLKQWDDAVKHQTLAIGLAQSQATAELPKMKEDLVRYQRKGVPQDSLFKDRK